jgi:hypothetical protein
LLLASHVLLHQLTHHSIFRAMNDWFLFHHQASTLVWTAIVFVPFVRNGRSMEMQSFCSLQIRGKRNVQKLIRQQATQVGCSRWSGELGGAHPKDMLDSRAALLEDIHYGTWNVCAAIPVVHYQQAVLGSSHHFMVAGQERCFVILQLAFTLLSTSAIHAWKTNINCTINCNDTWQRLVLRTQLQTLKCLP